VFNSQPSQIAITVRPGSAEDDPGVGATVRNNTVCFSGPGPNSSATAVTVAPRIVALAGINLLNGKVARRSSGSGAAEVSLQLVPGLALVGFAEPDSGLKLRQLAMAAIEESAVVIGLAA
jgi:hypothetical protein